MQLNVPEQRLPEQMTEAGQLLIAKSGQALTHTIGKSRLTDVNQALNHALHALSDPTRLAILRSLAEKPRAVGDLANGFPMSRPAISQHLKVLKSAGLVSDQIQGNRRVYGIDARGIEALRAHFNKLWSSVLDGYKQAAEAPPVTIIKEPSHAKPRLIRKRRRLPHP